MDKFHHLHLYMDDSAPELYEFITPNDDIIQSTFANPRKQNIDIHYLGYYECRFHRRVR